TRAGAQKLAELTGALEPVFVPTKIDPFCGEYKHRIDTIDCHIAVRQFAKQTGFQVDFVYTYFGRGDERFNTRVTYQGEHGEKTIVPDMVFRFTSPRGITRLYALEVYEGPRRTLYAFDRLSVYAAVIGQEAIEQTFNVQDSAVQVLAVFGTASGERLIRERLARETSLASSRFAPLFFFKALADVKADFRHGWRQVGRSDTVSLF
ncbi:MAG: hypothetical protein ICV68_18390, partial [Pyrinomonadaceae bacterium]|nr:hypothetical protein [Pyrinomonadaceae bacterium]